MALKYLEDQSQTSRTSYTLKISCGMSLWVCVCVHALEGVLAPPGSLASYVTTDLHVKGKTVRFSCWTGCEAKALAFSPSAPYPSILAGTRDHGVSDGGMLRD